MPRSRPAPREILAVNKEHGRCAVSVRERLQYADVRYIVAEATDSQNELFGTERMLEALNRRLDGGPDALLPGVKAEIDRFVGEAPQFDDITMLGLRYLGPAGQKEEP